MKNKTIILPVIATAMLLLIISIVSACSCIYLENTEAKMKNADYVFTGKVIDIDLSQSYANQEMQEVTIQVINYWKPTSFPESVNLIIYATKDTGANCGYNFKEDESYLIYANIDAETNNISTGLCNGNLILSKAQTEINELNELTNSTNNPPTTEPIESNIFTKFFSWLRNLFS